MKQPPIGQLYEVGGRRLSVHRSGSGSPAVVFLAGAGAVGLDYFNVQQCAAEVTTSVLYDRGGTGWSEPVNLPRSSAEVTDELEQLLSRAEVPTPYVLVGHSLGGLYARHFATRFPDRVAGLVLLDPAHEDFDAYMPSELVERRKAWDPDQALPDVLPDEVIQLYRNLFAQEMTAWPASVREPLIDGHVSLEWLRVGLQEAKNVDRLYEEIRASGSTLDVPLIVLCSTGIDDFKRVVSAGQDPGLLQQEIEGRIRLYTALAASVSQGEIRLVDAGHVTISFRQPGVVFDAIRDVMCALGVHSQAACELRGK